MRAFLDNRLKQTRDFFGKMARKDKIKLAILAVVIIILAIVIVSVLSRTDYETLYVAQSTSEAGKVYQALRDMNEPAKVEGTKILVPEGKSSELRALLATQGVIDSDDPDLLILEGAAGFGITDSYSQKLFEAQRASEIRAQILKSEKIQGAIVTVNFGEYSPFVVSSGVRDATAAVMLVIRGGAMLTNQEAQAIADLVKANVPGVEYGNISITDNNLNHYPVGEESVDIGTEINSRMALQNLFVQQLQSQGEQLLTPVFGASNVRIAAHVRLSFDEKVTETVEFFPPVPGELDGIVRSSSELLESQRRANAAEGIPGTDSNAMGTVEYPYGTLDDGDVYRRAVIEKNYEINETRETINHEQGKIIELGMAVLIDSESVAGDYTTEVANLVSKGLGISPESIAVEHVPFSDHGVSPDEIQAEMEAYEAQARRKEMLQTIIMWAVILLLGLALISLIKSIVRAFKAPVEYEEPALIDGGIDYIVDDDDIDIDEIIVDEQPEEVELNKKSTSLEQIERFIDKDPGAVAQLLRNWLTDD